ncbi:MAG: phosphatase [Bacteroidota bacterium]
MERVAIMDLGTNTFNLLVAEENHSGPLKVLFENKLPVKIGKGGIHKKSILPDAMERALTAVKEHAKKTKEFQTEKKIAYGTSALRGASNGKELMEKIKAQSGFDVHIIDGNREAELIYFGIRESVELTDVPVLILDIGGGSNELIIANRKKIFWKKSFDLGIARLLELFHPSDPIQKKEIEEISRYFKQELTPFFEAQEQFQPKRLIGASGTFDTFVSMLAHAYPQNINEDKISQPIPMVLFDELYNNLINSTLNERKKMPGLVEMRLEMIVLATYFVKFIMDETSVNELWHSAYSLKEGAASEIFRKHIIK